MSDSSIVTVVLIGSEEGAGRGVRGGKEGLLEEVSLEPEGGVLLI